MYNFYMFVLIYFKIEKFTIRINEIAILIVKLIFIIWYSHNGVRTGKRGRPRIKGEKIDFEKLDLAFNASLASVNIAKVMRKRYYPSLSIGLLKACLSNSYMLKRIFSKSGLKPNRTFNTKLVKELFGLVAEAA